MLQSGDSSNQGTLIALVAIVFLLVTAVPIVAQQQSPATLRGRVVSAEGAPVSGATVFVALPGPSNLRIRNGNIFFENHGAGEFTHVLTDATGQYELPAPAGEFAVAAIAGAGFARLDQDATAKNADLRLTSWGRIQGHLMVGTKPGAHIDLRAYSIEQAKSPSPVRISMVNIAETNAEGDFVMECVVPGTIAICRDFRQQSGGDGMVFDAEIGSTKVEADQTTTIDLGGVGRPVVGKIIFPPALNPLDYFINARAVQSGVRDSSSVQYFLAVDEKHSFRIDDVPPGNYRIHIFLQKVRGDRTAQPEQTTFTVPEIPGGVSDEPLVIQDIQLK
jgi:hypothetical protein